MTLGWFQDQNNVSLLGLANLENGWLERTGYRQTVFDKVVKVKYTPRPQKMVYDGLVATGYTTSQPEVMNDWISSTTRQWSTMACTFGSIRRRLPR